MWERQIDRGSLPFMNLVCEFRTAEKNKILGEEIWDGNIWVEAWAGEVGEASLDSWSCAICTATGDS